VVPCSPSFVEKKVQFQVCSEWQKQNDISPFILLVCRGRDNISGTFNFWNCRFCVSVLPQGLAPKSAHMHSGTLPHQPTKTMTPKAHVWIADLRCTLSQIYNTSTTQNYIHTTDMQSKQIIYLETKYTLSKKRIKHFRAACDNPTACNTR
jgi:hypothetical protein